MEAKRRPSERVAPKRVRSSYGCGHAEVSEEVMSSVREGLAQ